MAHINDNSLLVVSTQMQLMTIELIRDTKVTVSCASEFFDLC